MISLKNLVKTQSKVLKLQNQLICSFARSKFNYQLNIKEDLINVKDLKRPYDLEESTESPAKPRLYLSPLKKKELEGRKKKEFILYQQQLKQQAENQIQNKKQQGKESVEKEFLWDTGYPPERPYDNPTNKELQYIYRDEKYFQRADKMISHLSEFQQPYTIHDQQIRDLIDSIKEIATVEVIQNSSVDFSIEQFYQNNEAISEKLSQLRELVQKVNYKLLPQIGLSLAYELRYKIDVAGVWEAYVENLDKNLHHYSPIEMAQIKHALHGNFPKIGSPSLHKAFLDIIVPELYLCTIQELMHIFHAFRNLRSDKIQSKIMKEFQKRKNDITNPEDLANVLYTYATCRIRTQNRKKFRLDKEELIEAEEFLGEFIDLLNKNLVDNISLEGAIKVATSLHVLRLPGRYQDILQRVEKNVLKNKEQLDSTLLAQILYVFSKVQNGKGFGSQQFFAELLPLVESQFGELTNGEKSKILYAYSQRKQISESQFENIFLPWIETEIANFSYTDLHYVGYSLMYNNCTDKYVWKSFVHNVVAQPYSAPTYHYLPLKFVRFYLDSLFPTWNLEPYEEACRSAEFSFNTMRIKNTHFNQDMNDMAKILTQKLEVDTKILVEFDNLLIVDFAILPEKVAILYQEESFSQYDDLAVSLPIYDLRAKILEANGWGVVRLSKKEFQDQGLEKMDWLKQKVEEVYKQQVQNYKDQELDRWGYVVDKIERMGEKATLPNERHKDSHTVVQFN